MTRCRAASGRVRLCRCDQKREAPSGRCRHGRGRRTQPMVATTRRAVSRALLAILFAVVLGAMAPARAADPIKVGFSMALTGAVAPNGKQNLLALEIWRDDVNAKGGLLGRPVELVYYDDQSNPNNVPGIYTKLISVDKVDLLIGPYATNMIAPAMPVIMQAGKMTIGMLGVNVNRQFNYSRYFSMVPGGDEGTLAFSRGWFEIAAAQTPKPKTVALIAADAEFGKTACDGARENAKAGGFEIVYDKSYPPGTTDMVPIVRAIAAANPELDFPGLKAMLEKYQAKAPSLGIDPLGYGFTPFAYAAGQVLAQAVEATKSL